MPDGPDQLRLQIEHTREELGETVADLAHKTDVKAQANAKADEVKEKVHAAEDTVKLKARAVAGHAKEKPVPLVIGAVVLLAVLSKVRKRRRALRIERRLMEDALQHAFAGGMPAAAVLVDPRSTGPLDRRALD
jgi:hypothetical protein